MDNLEYFPIETYTQKIDAYVISHAYPGLFLDYFLQHSLDDLKLLVKYLSENVPSQCYGSKEAIDEWIDGCKC